MRPAIPAALLAIAALHLLACPSVQEIEIDEKVAWTSAPLTLVISNDTAADLQVLPAVDVDSPPLSIAPLDTGEIQFRALRLKAQDTAGGDEFGLRDLRPAPETPYLRPSGGEDYHLRIRFADGSEFEYLIELFDAWFEEPPGQEGLTVIVDGPPLAGLPANF